MAMAVMFKMVFEFASESDWPPVAIESLWVERIEGDRYLVDNIPFFVSDLACGDEVLALPNPRHPRSLELVSVIKRSGNSTIRIIVRDGDVLAARDEFREIGCASELSHLPQLFAVDIPGCALGAALELAQFGFEVGRWDYEEGFVFE